MNIFPSDVGFPASRRLTHKCMNLGSQHAPLILVYVRCLPNVAARSHSPPRPLFSPHRWSPLPTSDAVHIRALKTAPCLSIVDASHLSTLS